MVKSLLKHLEMVSQAGDWGTKSMVGGVLTKHIADRCLGFPSPQVPEMLGQCFPKYVPRNSKPMGCFLKTGASINRYDLL